MLEFLSAACPTRAASDAMQPIFADPKTDFIFKRIFGTESHKHLLVELLNAL
ncbi:MAG: hypothetical protein GY856_46370, partial [bacterium]|nr:hypothetical protein [bacterium]